MIIIITMHCIVTVTIIIIVTVTITIIIIVTVTITIIIISIAGVDLLSLDLYVGKGDSIDVFHFCH